MNNEAKELASSRPLGVASELGAASLSSAVVYSKRVILTGEFLALSTRNGRWCFLDSLRLLSRVVGVLEVMVPEGLGELQQEVDQLIANLWSQGTVRRIQTEQLGFDGATAILNIGAQVRPNLPWTSVLANGWVARCTSGTRPLPSNADQDNPVSCMLAASFGVTEVFKRVYAIPADKAAPMEDVAFSLFDLSSQFNDCGPLLPTSIHLPETLLLGAGAIGNGLVLLLSQLPLAGHLFVMDKQTFGTENYGTCALLDSADWIGSSKAKMLASWLKTASALDADGELSTIEDALNSSAFNNTVDIVINGLDDIGARRAVQKLWPSLIVDGAINSVGASVVTHSVKHRKFACLRCTFPESNEDHRALQMQATGLHRSSLEGDQNRPISEEDIAMADEVKRGWLKVLKQQGQTICSTVSIGIADQLGMNLEKGFRPSVPFVATASAALVVAQVLKHLLSPTQRFVHEFQFSSLFVGASTAVTVGRLASPSCECTKHAAIIDQLAKKRRNQQQERFCNLSDSTMSAMSQE